MKIKPTKVNITISDIVDGFKSEFTLLFEEISDVGVILGKSDDVDRVGLGDW